MLKRIGESGWLRWADKRMLIRPDEWKGKEDEGVLYVPKAGEILYRLKR